MVTRKVRLHGALLIVAVQTTALIALGTRLGTSSDEEYTLRTTASGLFSAIRLAYSSELQAPLYFAICSCWRQIDQSPYFARLFSIIATAAFSLIIALISKRIAPNRSVVPAIALAAVNPFVIYAAEDIRPYALGLLLSAIAGLAFLETYWYGTASLRGRLAFILIGILTVYTEYYLAFGFVGFAVALVVAPRSRRMILRYIADASVVALSLVATLPLIRSTFQAYDFAQSSVHASAIEVFEEPWRAFVISSDGLRHIGVPHVVYALLCLTFVAAFAIARVRFSATATRGFLGVVVAIDLLYVLTTVFAHVDLAPPRHYLAATVPLVVTLAVALQCIKTNDIRGRLSYVSAIAIYTVACATTTLYQFHSLSSGGDWRNVVGYLRINTRAHDRVLVFPPEAIPAFDRAGGSYLLPLGFPSSFEPTHYDIKSFLPLPSDALAAVAALRGIPGRTWLVVACEYRPLYAEEGCPQIERALAIAFPHHGVTSFFGSWIAELYDVSNENVRRGAIRGATAARRRSGLRSDTHNVARPEERSNIVRYFQA